MLGRLLGCPAGSDRNWLVSWSISKKIRDLQLINIGRGYDPFTKYHGHPSREQTTKSDSDPNSYHAATIFGEKFCVVKIHHFIVLLA